ncbi:MAG: porin [Ottowia sp.]|nr:porin [Ottowia sp.]
MKKCLIACAAMGLAGLGFSGVAVAQSSVTLYGVADAGIGKVKSAGDDRVHMLSSSMMNNGTSRLGVRGTEDLGGGLKAGFNFEQGLSLNDGQGNLSGGNTWSRAANVWIGGDWGTLTLGRRLNPSYDAEYMWELTGGANYYVAGPTYNYAGQGDTRTSSQFMYATPDIGGFSAELAYVAKDDNAGKHKFDVGLMYQQGPIGVGLAINKTKSEKTNYSLGGRYSFGQIDVAASYARVGDDSTPTRERRRYTLGASYQMNPFTVTLDLARDVRNHTSVNNKKYTNGVLEGKYALSKRTFVYAAYLRLDGDNNYGLGLRHNF